MRAATRKVRWWVQRGMMPSDEVILYRIKMERKQASREIMRGLVQRHAKGRSS